MLDILSKVDTKHKVIYVWFDTGIEYQATKNHLNYLEEKYGIHIQREKAIKSIPFSCKEYGQPFLSKHVSEQIDRLQRHGFQLAVIHSLMSTTIVSSKSFYYQILPVSR